LIAFMVLGVQKVHHVRQSVAAGAGDLRADTDNFAVARLADLRFGHSIASYHRSGNLYQIR
jgi:hypothetical protein